MRDDYIKVRRAARSRLTVADFSGGADYRRDESVMDPALSADSYNFDFSEGVLGTGYGLTEYDGFAGKEIRALWLYKRFDAENGVRDDRLLAVDRDGALWERSEGEPKRLGAATLTGEPYFTNYRLYGEDVALICTEADGMFVYNGVSEPYKVEGAPGITSLALHYERLFVTVGGEKNAVWFSDDLDPTNWDASLSGGGFIQLLDERGACEKVISFLGYVYVFREKGISRITAYGSQTEFSVSNLFVSGGRIYPGSVTVCGDTVIFLAADGLYSFDGVSAAKILPGLGGLFADGGAARAYYLGGKYYLSFRREERDGKIGCEEGEYVNNGLLVLDLGQMSYALGRGLDIVGMSTADDNGVIAIGSDGRAGVISRCGSAFGAPLKKRWRAPITDLGRTGVKRIREVYLATETPVTLTLMSDEGEKTLAFSGKRGIQRKRTSFSGRRIGFAITCETPSARISRPYFIMSGD